MLNLYQKYSKVIYKIREVEFNSLLNFPLFICYIIIFNNINYLDVYINYFIIIINIFNLLIILYWNFTI